MTEKSSGLRVLIVDDEPLLRWSMAETLTEAGHLVTEAGDARETLEWLSAGPPPDVVLLDYRLPDSNDLTLLETLRRVAPNTPVILITAYATSAVEDGALRLGAYRVLSKPVEMGELPFLVRQAYASRSE
jgi:DNA-binding NtrC family response regulator